MTKNFLAVILLAASVFACNSADNKTKMAVTDIEVANAFVRGLLDNNFEEAEQYLLKDETNTQIFERFKDQYSHKDKVILEGYKNAYIKVNETSYVTDSIFIFNYSNSYSLKDKTTLKLVRINNKWLVDLKYTFSGNL